MPTHAHSYVRAGRRRWRAPTTLLAAAVAAAGLTAQAPTAADRAAEQVPVQLANVHPHALQGAIASLAVMWRLPVLRARDPEDSLRLLRLFAQQVSRAGPQTLKRYDRKPKRVASRKLYVLQGLPGVGPALAHRLLLELGSIERVVTADAATLMQVRGIGPTTAARIRELLR